MASNDYSVLVVKLVSIIIHYEEFTSEHGQPADKQAIEGLLSNPDVVKCFIDLQSGGLLPLKRN